MKNVKEYQIVIGDKTAVAAVDNFKGKQYFSLRFLYEDPLTGTLRHSKNGINVDVSATAEPALDLIHEAVRLLANATDQTPQDILAHISTPNKA